MNTKPTLIIDFDSTFVCREGLEALAELALADRPDRLDIIADIRRITDLGMEGKIPFSESLDRRLKMIGAKKDHIPRLVDTLKDCVTPSILRNEAFFRTNASRIYIVSGGFREFIEPIARLYGIGEDHIMANTFVYDSQGMIAGADKKNPLTRIQGKPNILRRLGLPSPVFMVGDGYTDAEVKLFGVADYFIAFTEHVRRERAIDHADYVAGSFDEVIDYIY